MIYSHQLFCISSCLIADLVWMMGCRNMCTHRTLGCEDESAHTLSTFTGISFQPEPFSAWSERFTEVTNCWIFFSGKKSHLAVMLYLLANDFQEHAFACAKPPTDTHLLPKQHSRCLFNSRTLCSFQHCGVAQQRIWTLGLQQQNPKFVN